MKNKIEIINNVYPTPIDIDTQKDYDSVLQKYYMLKAKSLSRSNSVIWIILVLVSFSIVGLLVFNKLNQAEKNEGVLSDIEDRSTDEYSSGWPELTSESAINDSSLIEKPEIPENIDRQNVNHRLIEAGPKPTAKQEINDVKIEAPLKLSAKSEVPNKVTLDAPKEAKGTEKKPDIILEEAYPLDGFENLYSWFETNISYPEEHRKDAIEGYVKVSFLLGKDSTISEIKVNQSLGLAFDREAVRLIEQMPKWVPAKRDGIPFSKRFILPIGFKMVSR
jgi:TonB family protein